MFVMAAAVPELSAWINPTVTIVTVGVAAWITIWTTSKSVRASTVTKSRQEYISELKKNVADLLRAQMAYAFDDDGTRYEKISVLAEMETLKTIIELSPSSAAPKQHAELIECLKAGYHTSQAMKKLLNSDSEIDKVQHVKQVTLLTESTQNSKNAALQILAAEQKLVNKGK